jgi:para-aminobenzoate synthetase / 4-amino-4-deoxychorismate lyase
MRNISLRRVLSELSREKHFVFLETNKLDSENQFSYLFTNPLHIIECRNSDSVRPSIKKLERMLKKGYFAAGFISYEAGFVLEKVFNDKKVYDFPLLWFGIFKKPVIFDHRKIKFNDTDDFADFDISGIKPDISEKEYIKSIEKIKTYIEQGHTYQVNRTFKMDFSFKGSLEDLYLYLRKKQGVAYSAFIKFQETSILSFSPELFFRKKKFNIAVKPMKGTMPRGRFSGQDAKNARLLYNCPKNRSENIMIVDLLRNDLGRISKTGTVRVKKFFEIEKYESLWQMTSSVKAMVQPKVSLYEIFQSIFPSGSVTGAPKIRTMQIINELEKSPRRIYTGSIGFFTPKMDSVFNVAIRTLLLDIRGKKGEMGVGSGIIYDSDPKNEYEECLLKAKFLTETQKSFKLIETILWEPVKGYPLLRLHMQRLSGSAEYFGYKYKKDSVIKALNNASKGFDKKQKYRVRLLLDKNGATEISYSALDLKNMDKPIAISSKVVDSSDKWLYHKTTNRALYNSEYSKYKKKGFFDVIFKNEKGQITEGAISNIFVVKNNIYYTPPIECGVLNGIYRRYLLNNRKIKIKEKAIYLEDLLSADVIVMTNAIRGMVEVSLNSVKEHNINTEYARP